MNAILKAGTMGHCGRLSALALALLAVSAAACAPSNQSGASSPSPPAPAAAAKPAAASPTSATTSTAGVLPKTCNERVPVSVVSTAVGKSLKLTKEIPAESGLLCYYDFEGASPSPTGFVGKLTYTALDHAPTRQEVNDYINLINKNVGTAKIEETSGLGDYSGFATITISGSGTTAYAVIATKGKLIVDFATFSLFSDGDRAKLSEIVRKGLG
jgi:hypothetical protein